MGQNTKAVEILQDAIWDIEKAQADAAYARIIGAAEEVFGRPEFADLTDQERKQVIADAFYGPIDGNLAVNDHVVFNETLDDHITGLPKVSSWSEHVAQLGKGNQDVQRSIARYEAAMQQLTDASWDLNGRSRQMKAAELEAAAVVADTLKDVLEHAAATWPGRLRELIPHLTVEQFHQVVYYLDAGYDATAGELAQHAAKDKAA
ncbi:hypothetical protein [Nonomuraea sp. B5E05]|uniref:hypothetical protein n=1 Tax=Nonomuraea sp. B5E05 TaxID=3153569 RepID=UPI003260DE25